MDNPHKHEDLYGESGEIPVFFSHTASISFEKPITGNELYGCLAEWIETLQYWLVQNKYFIGHIKTFTGSEEGFSLWVSATGKNINAKGFPECRESECKSCVISMTVIVFGINKDLLKNKTLEFFEKCMHL